MKQLIYILAIILSVLMVSCSTDVHYDSVSTVLEVELADVDKYEDITIHQRYQFDRDLATLTSMSLVEAWVASPDGDYESPEFNEFIRENYSLSILDSISISVYDPEIDSPVLWLVVPASRLVGEDAMFSYFDLGNILDYLDNLQQLEISVDISLNNYQALKYWSDICSMSDDCVLRVPISMQFKMEE